MVSDLANLLPNDKMHTPCRKSNDLRIGVCILVRGDNYRETALRYLSMILLPPKASVPVYMPGANEGLQV